MNDQTIWVLSKKSFSSGVSCPFATHYSGSKNSLGLFPSSLVVEKGGCFRVMTSKLSDKSLKSFSNFIDQKYAIASPFFLCEFALLL